MTDETRQPKYLTIAYGSPKGETNLGKVETGTDVAIFLTSTHQPGKVVKFAADDFSEVNELRVRLYGLQKIAQDRTSSSDPLTRLDDIEAVFDLLGSDDWRATKDTFGVSALQIRAVAHYFTGKAGKEVTYGQAEKYMRDMADADARKAFMAKAFMVKALKDLKALDAEAGDATVDLDSMVEDDEG